MRGDVVVNPETDFVEERFAVGATLWTRSDRGEEALTIASARVQNGRPIVGFDGFARVEDVERLAGLELRVPEEALQQLVEHTYYQHQLVGCAVETKSGEPVGPVARVDGGIGGDFVAGHSGRDHLTGGSDSDTVDAAVSDDGSPDAAFGEGGNDSVLTDDGVGNDTYDGGLGADGCAVDAGDVGVC